MGGNVARWHIEECGGAEYTRKLLLAGERTARHCNSSSDGGCVTAFGTVPMRALRDAAALPSKSQSETRKVRSTGIFHPLIGYLFHCGRTVPRQASVQASGLSLTFGCPCWLCGSHLACAVPGAAHERERFRGLHCSK